MNAAAIEASFASVLSNVTRRAGMAAKPRRKNEHVGYCGVCTDRVDVGRGYIERNPTTGMWTVFHPNCLVAKAMCEGCTLSVPTGQLVDGLCPDCR